MDIAGRILLFGGFFVVFAFQMYIVVLAFRRRVLQGFLCLIVPAYIVFWAMRAETRRPKALMAWFGGFLAIIIGVVVLTDY
jgi:hypothetical protein